MTPGAKQPDLTDFVIVTATGFIKRKRKEKKMRQWRSHSSLEPQFTAAAA